MSTSNRTAMPASVFALGGVAVCALIWGTTWYAITHQLGAVDPVVSVVMRFGLASAVLFAVVKATGGRIGLTARQHLAVLGQGGFAFSVSYLCVYRAEENIASAIVAVIFAALAFVNLLLFRLASGQKAAKTAWLGAALGVIGVAVLSGGEILAAGLSERAALGVGLSVTAVIASAFGNWFAWRGQQAGAGVLAGTAWAMAYGTILLGLFGLLTGVSWAVEWTPAYVISLLYLSLFGSVIAFGLYFTIARARGYALASYISALTPPIAMGVSVLFEGARFGPSALVGLLLVLAGQLALSWAPRKSASG